jgi:DNA-directed RNA polymerase specialized sigma24 family protein
MDGEKVILLVEFLPNPYRQIMYMKYVLELTITEMSSITGKTKNTIAVQSHRGLEKLKSLYYNQ